MMDFEKALQQDVITAWEYDLIAIVDENAQLIVDDQIASDALNEILEKVFQWELCGSKMH